MPPKSKNNKKKNNNNNNNKPQLVCKNENELIYFSYYYTNIYKIYCIYIYI